MPSAPLTREQQMAVATRHVSIALSAGAGCGKTHVLTERFMAHLAASANGKAPTKLGQLVAITFTDAAAREMRSRIRSTCYDRLAAAATAEEQHYWLRLLREIDSARVSTIHAFCASLLRTHAAAADLDPTFSVLDQGEADLIQYEVIDDVLRQQLSDLDSDTLDLAAAYGLARLKQQVAVLLTDRHDPCFTRWLDATPDDIVARWRTWHDREAFPTAVREIAENAPLSEIVELLHSVTPAKPAFVEAKEQLLELLPKLQRGAITAAELDGVCRFARVKSREGPFICTAKDWNDKDAYTRYSKCCESLRKCIEKHQPAEWNDDVALETARLGLALLRQTSKVAEKYEARKRARGALDFDDLLSAAHGLIADPQKAALNSQIADDLRLLLVDEFQDTDQLQVDLVKALCGPGFENGRLFFVGDFKQSIYRFRGAEPKVFRDLRARVDESGRLPLTVNFRSQPAILHFVNALFCDAFSKDGSHYEPLRAHRAQTTEPPNVEFLWTIVENKNDQRTPGNALAARRQEASAIARRICSLIDERSTERPIVDKDTGQPRPLQLRDVAILFRALSDVQVYEEALRDYGLDYYLVGGHAFYAQQEIYDVLNLLRAVASSADELSLAGVLRSPVFALADETLFWLVDSAGSLNAGLLTAELPQQLSPEETAKVAAAAATIQYLRSVKDRIPIARLMGEALDRTGYDAVLLTEFLGQRKLANLHKLIERARIADQGGIDLDGFITQLAQFVVRDPKEALAATLPEAANVVRLMTIHHAKGLEFPLVIVPDLDRKPFLVPPPAALHPELGPIVSAPLEDDSNNATTGMTLFAAAERAEEREERKRMLYVAATRASDYLIFSSSLEAYDKPQSDWMKLLAERFDLGNGRVIAELPSGFEAPAVLITSDPTTGVKPAGKSRGPDLIKLLEEAHQLAAGGSGIVPPAVGPIPVDHAARRTFSFSRLSGPLVEPECSPLAPRAEIHLAERDDYTQTLDPRGFGSLVHDVFAHVDLQNPVDLRDWCEHLAPQHVISNADEAATAAQDLIARLLASPVGRQMSDATAIHREVEFLLAWPPGEPNGDAAHLRGYIDCLFQDRDGNWRIFDFKTNNVPPAEIPRQATRYEMQLYVYAIAAERALGQPPVELTLHFLRPGVQHTFAWNAAARQRAVDMVNAAIMAARTPPTYSNAPVANPDGLVVSTRRSSPKSVTK